VTTRLRRIDACGRGQVGGFEDAADLATYANLDPHHVDVLREFLVLPRT
jgi:hypothetical protein